MKFVGFVVSSLIGYVIAHYLLDGAAAAYASILISYHLYLVFLIFVTVQQREFAMPMGQLLGTHLAFLALLIGVAYSRNHIPFFGLIRLLIPGLAPFEAQWLFGKTVVPIKSGADEKPADVSPATNEEHDAFRDYMRLEYRPFRKPGMTLNEEFSAWLADRRKKEQLAAAAANAQSNVER